ncbi:MAG: folate family ECF transporter S component [Catonella sp.]
MMNEKEVTKKSMLFSELQGIVNFPVSFVKETAALPKTLRKSAGEFKKLQTVVFCGLMGALSIILGLFASIHFGPFSITYAWIPNRIIDFMFGPVVGALYGGVMDVIKFMLKPNGSFNLAYTAMAVLAGLIFGVVLYNKQISFMRIVFAQTLVKIFINVGMGTYLMAFERGQAFMALMPVRLIKNLIMIPLDSILLFIVLSALTKILPRLKK